ncbi:type I-F CRISPR-associated protein Csy1 [Lamprobacter modestohalophilus]|uniref:type I-F CRISPR-associated protein Csy1 n=1 Tax=Lamprobacter modestohalophilus TaxID=1064514 RepID=UPI0030844690
MECHVSTQLNGRQQQIHNLIKAFLTERLNAKLEKLPEDDPKRAALIAQFEPAAWLKDAAHRSGQIQVVTHSLKPLHPDAKGTSLFREPTSLEALEEVGSHVLGDDFEIDVVGNAAALDVYKFLKIEYDGRTLLSLALEQDADLAAALDDNLDLAHAWMQAFAGLAQPRLPLRSHTHAKQIYWLVGPDPHDDTGYHLLAPLYPTSLVHRVYQTLQDDRFSEDAKAARAARKAQQWHERPVHEYPNLAVQKLGGTKPQNISQLNSERRGDNVLLASLPPVWQSLTIKPLLAVESLFNVFGWRREVKTLMRQLCQFLESDPANNLRTRQRRDALVDALIDELIQFSAELRTLEPGWSTDPECALPPTQRAWLDPDADAEQQQHDDITDRLADDFSRWLNNRLRQPLPLGDPEYLYWRKLAGEQLRQYAWEVGHDA